MPLTKAKAQKMMKDGKAKGKPLTKKQKKFFGSVIGCGMKCEKGSKKY